MTTIYIQKMKYPELNYEKIYNDMDLQATALVGFSTSYYGLSVDQRDFVNELIDRCNFSIKDEVDDYNESIDEYGEDVYVNFKVRKE